MTDDRTRDRGRFSCDVDGLTPCEWDSIVAEFSDMNLFQTAAFADGFRGERRMSHLLLRRDGVPVAGARVAVMKPPGFPSGVAYVKHGPFWRRAGMPPDEGVYEAIVAALVGEYAGRRGHMLSIVPRPHPDFERVEERLLRDAGFAARSRLKRPISYFLVKTGTDETALRANLSQSWRHNLKLAERNRLDIRFRDPVEALPDFHALHDAMVARKRLADRAPLHLLPSLFRQLPPACSRIVTASHRGEVVAGAVLVVAGDIGYYLFGASADAALPLRAGYALHWRIAVRLSEQGVGWYDLGDGFGCLSQFKRGMVGKSGAVLERAGEFDRWESPQARMLGEAIYGVRNLGLTLRSCKRWIRKKSAALRAARSRGGGPLASYEGALEGRH